MNRTNSNAFFINSQKVCSHPSSYERNIRKIQLQLELEHGTSISKPPDDWPIRWVFLIGYYI